MKKIITMFVLIFITNTSFAKKNVFVFENKTQVESYKSYQIANQELRNLEFKLSEVKINKYFMYERNIGDKFYQVFVRLYKNKIIIDTYCFSSVKKQWRSKNYGDDVMKDIIKSITYRIKYNITYNPVSLLRTIKRADN